VRVASRVLVAELLLTGPFSHCGLQGLVVAAAVTPSQPRVRALGPILGSVLPSPKNEGRVEGREAATCPERRTRLVGWSVRGGWRRGPRTSLRAMISACRGESLDYRSLRTILDDRLLRCGRGCHAHNQGSRGLGFKSRQPDHSEP
jgi:hypothetical protein